MNLARFFFILGLMLSIAMANPKYISAQVIDGPIGRNQLKRNVLKMVYQEKFDDLERMAQEFRKTKARFPEGTWKMEYFYKGLCSPKDESPDGWKRFMPKFDKWLRLYPDSVTARVAAASAWNSFAWNARGGGYANTVSAEGWRLFEERMEKAYSIVVKKPNKSRDDCIGRHYLLLDIANAQGWDRAQYEELFREAVSFEPTYLVHYVTKVYYLLPRWRGKRGEWQQFAQEAVKMTPPKEGKAVYMRILWGCWNMKEFKSFNEPGISWPMMKQGFIDTERNFPGSSWNLNNFCRFAYFAGDKETVQKLLSRIGNRPYWEAWERQEFQECQKLAGVQNPHVLKFNPWIGTEDFRQFLYQAERGDAEAQYEIGKLHYGNASSPFGRSDHVAQFKEAFNWFRKAAEQGHPKAQSYLASMYTSGTGVKPDPKEALRWNQTAASQGDENACFSMGYAYYNGQGVGRDWIKAYAWLAQMEQQHPILKDLSSKLTHQKMKQAEKEAEKIRQEVHANKKAAESK